MKTRFFPNLRRVRQITPSHCGPAVIQMLLGYWNKKATQAAIVEAAGVAKKIKKHGVLVSDMARAVRELAPGLNFWFKENSTTEELFELVMERSFPAGVEWQGDFGEDSDGDDGHYSVVTNIDQKAGVLHIADPYGGYAGRDRSFSIPEFERRWWDMNFSVLDFRTLFIVAPEDFFWPRSLGMVKA